MKDILARDKESIWHPFTPLIEERSSIAIDSAEGVYLYSSEGKKIIDGISSWWVNLHGHSNPHIANAIYEQAKKLEHVIFAGFTHEPAVRLAESLLEIMDGAFSKVFFSDNGSTSVEVSLKMALQYWFNSEVNRTKIIAIEGAYHGDTFGSMSVGARSLFSKPFDPLLFSVDFIPFPTDFTVLDSLEKFLAEGDVAAFIYEPLVQGASGMRMYDASILDKMLSMVRESGGLLIADEVFTGFGRTGKLFASDYMENKPDLVSLSKGITGGALPLGVTLASEKIVDAFNTEDRSKTFFHGHSYTANPISCAAANASLELLLDPKCQLNVEMICKAQAGFVKQCRGHASIIDIRSLGTILAIELKTHDVGSYLSEIRDQAYEFFMQKEVLLRPLGNVIYFLPPYVISREEMEYVHDCIEEFLECLLHTSELSS